MKNHAVGPNDPCPCGSGKTFSQCCLGREEPLTSGQGAGGAPESLRQALAGHQFHSLKEVQAFIAQHVQQQNQRARDDFHGLSPEQMRRLLYFPFASPQVVQFPDTLDIDPQAPILALFDLLVEAIGDQGLKPTAKGNLPRKFCREAALTYKGDSAYRGDLQFHGINREDDFADLHVTRLVSELAGLIRKSKGRFILSRNCRTLLDRGGRASIYPRLLRAYIERFNWGYLDGYRELPLIQQSFLFTLYLLTRHGATWLPHQFYEDNFLRAFPSVLNELPRHPVFSPEEEIRGCYTLRTLERFAGFLGLAEVEPMSEQRYPREYRLKTLPLLHEAVQFHIGG